MQTQIASPQTDAPVRTVLRLHYLDWLRVLAILGVFLFHAVHPFDLAGWHIKNAELSEAVTYFLALLFPWGMPLFFILAGAGSWFALQRRTGRQYASERFSRLLIPFIGGALVLMPVMLIFEWIHKTQTGVLTMSFTEFVFNRAQGFSPRWFGALGYHLWFLGFLFACAMITLPLFHWLRGQSGRQFIARLAAVTEHRGGILLFALPLVLLQLGLRPFFPLEHDWADFCYLMDYFSLGYILFAHEQFARAIRRDWSIILVAAVITMVTALAIAMSKPALDLEAAPQTASDFVFWGLMAVCGWSWSTFMLFVGMRWLDFTNRWLTYGQEASLPVFVLHQPVIIVIAFFVVQWETAIAIKLVIVVLSSLIVMVGLYELIIKRVDWLRSAFGMKPARLHKTQARAGAES